LAIYTFTGKTKDGKEASGTVEAFNKDQAIAVLRERSIVPISVSEKGSSFQDQVVAFTRQFATMVSAGLPLTQALTILQSQARSAQFKHLLKNSLAIIEGGAPLSKAFGAYPDVFDTLYINLVRAGESSGSLEKVFTRLASKMESADASICSA
jgi:type IV pilus assembly protein PilC